MHIIFYLNNSLKAVLADRRGEHWEEAATKKGREWFSVCINARINNVIDY
jgi:hypothetical protein